MSSHHKHHKKATNAGITNKKKGSLVKAVVPPDDSGEWIKPNTGDKFYIDDDANFPSIPFELKTDEPGPYKWSWVISWDAHVSGLREKPRGGLLRKFSKKGDFSQMEKTWDGNKINDVIGGKLVVTVQIGDTKFKRTVFVLGKPPSQEKIKAYLQAKGQSALEKLIAQESKFKHFINLDSEPVVAGDNGYGLTQLTHPNPTYSQIWSWKQNIDAAIKLIDEKKSSAQHYLNTHGQNSYTQEMLDNETITKWNGGTYYKWYSDPAPAHWERNREILCDKQTGNIGWDTSKDGNAGKSEADLHERDKNEYSKMKDGQTKEHPWTYTGVCYTDHVNNN